MAGFLVLLYVAGLLVFLIANVIMFLEPMNNKERRRSAQYVFASPIWPVFVGRAVVRSLYVMYKVAFGKEEK